MVLEDVAADVVGTVELVVADVSFISLRTVLPAIEALAGNAPIVALVKPQFEVGKGRVGKGGVVHAPALHEEAVAGVVGVAETLGRRCAASIESPITGAQGNKEFFVLLEKERR